MNTEEYRAYVREYLEATSDVVTEEEIDYYVWLWGGVT